MSQPDEAIIGARAEFPGFITPCLPTLRPAVPIAPGWVRALTRNGYDWTDRFAGDMRKESHFHRYGYPRESTTAAVGISIEFRILRQGERL
jgi:hypothetical protein